MADLQQPNVVWLNGRWLAEEEAVVPVTAHGLLYGEGVFETLRAYRGEPFRLRQHLERLFEGAVVIDLVLGWDVAVLVSAVRATVARRGLEEAAVRITAFRGAGPPGPDPAGCGDTLVLISARSFSGYPERIYREGARAILATTRQNEQSPLCRVKSVSYLNSLLARAEARRAAVDEALLLNSRGEMAEGSLSNLFIRVGDRLLTPPLECGCLPGLARAEILDLAPGSGYRPEEAPFTPATLLQADEALLTNSLLEVAPLVRVAGYPIGEGVPGEASKRLREAYRAAVRATLDA